MRKKVLIVIGTRPEAIKMAPVYMKLTAEPGFDVQVLSSGQHDELLHQVFQVFDWKADHTFKLTRQTQDVAELYALLFQKLNDAFAAMRPDCVVVHGDTATTAVASMVAFLRRIPVAHVEAGLRSFRREEPWPEEVNRKITDLVADFYFAPTALAKENLLAEGVDERAICVTGNTVVDALNYMSRKVESDAALCAQLEEEFHFLREGRKLLLLTGHRRENFGKNLGQVFVAVREIAERTGCVVAFPAHPNQKLQQDDLFAPLDSPRIHIMSPLTYPKFVYLMKRCDLIISDSGGIQEEAPAFGKRVLVTRNVTERPEGIAGGFLEMVGCDAEKITARAVAILADSRPLQAANPYGDGRAAERICDVLREQFLSGTAADFTPKTQRMKEKQRELIEG